MLNDLLFAYSSKKQAKNAARQLYSSSNYQANLAGRLYSLPAMTNSIYFL
jgi:hypothetical protein